MEAFSWWRPWVLNVLQGTGQARGTRTCLPQAGEAGQTDVALVVAAGSGGHPNSGSTAEGPTQISALSDPPPQATRHTALPSMDSDNWSSEKCVCDEGMAASPRAFLSLH